MITTTIGNYPKVAQDSYSTKLISTIAKWQRKEIDDAGLEETCRELTRAVIAEQEAAGIDLISDGQIRWEDLVTPLASKLAGFEINGLTRWFNNNVYYRRPVLTGAPKWTKPVLVEQYRFAAACTRKPVKAVLPGPYTFVKVSEDRHFKNEQKFVRRMAEIINQEARALANAGAAVIQFDEPAVGFAGVGKTNLKLALEALSTALEGVKAEKLVVTYFGELDGALPALMKSKADIIGIDIVSHPKNLQALKKAKISKKLAVGCMDARNTKLESVGELHAVFKAVGKLVPLKEVYVNPNAGLEFLPHPQALAKVQRLVEAVKSFKTRS